MARKTDQERTIDRWTKEQHPVEVQRLREFVEANAGATYLTLSYGNDQVGMKDDQGYLRAAWMIKVFIVARRDRDPWAALEGKRRRPRCNNIQLVLNPDGRETMLLIREVLRQSFPDAHIVDYSLTP